MKYELTDTEKGKHLFEGWDETMIWSCLQKVMGKIFVTDPEHPASASAEVGCFVFLAGEPDSALLEKMPDGFVIMVPQNVGWSKMIEACYPQAKKAVRYAIKKNTVFDREALKENVSKLPADCRLCKIDAELYDKCLNDPMAADFVSVFENKEKFLSLGRGMVITKNGEIISGASSYTRYHDGIEIEVDTAVQERRKHLATAACSALILDCLKDGLYPSWDAMNMNSVRLSEKLGYEFDHEYTVYEMIITKDTCDGKSEIDK